MIRIRILEYLGRQLGQGLTQVPVAAILDLLDPASPGTCDGPARQPEEVTDGAAAA